MRGLILRSPTPKYILLEQLPVVTMALDYRADWASRHLYGFESTGLTAPYEMLPQSVLPVQLRVAVVVMQTSRQSL